MFLKKTKTKKSGGGLAKFAKKTPASRLKLYLAILLGVAFLSGVIAVSSRVGNQLALAPNAAEQSSAACKTDSDCGGPKQYCDGGRCKYKTVTQVAEDEAVKAQCGDNNTCKRCIKVGCKYNSKTKDCDCSDGKVTTTVTPKPSCGILATWKCGEAGGTMTSDCKCNITKLECTNNSDCGYDGICINNRCSKNPTTTVTPKPSCGILATWKCGEAGGTMTSDCKCNITKLECTNNSDCGYDGICINNKCLKNVNCRNSGCKSGQKCEKVLGSVDWYSCVDIAPTIQPFPYSTPGVPWNEGLTQCGVDIQGNKYYPGSNCISGGKFNSNCECVELKIDCDGGASPGDWCDNDKITDGEGWVKSQYDDKCNCKPIINIGCKNLSKTACNKYSGCKYSLLSGCTDK